jgi:hypothetical protein
LSKHRALRSNKGGNPTTPCYRCKTFLIAGRKDTHCLDCRRIQRQKRARAKAERDPKWGGENVLALLRAYDS